MFRTLGLKATNQDRESKRLTDWVPDYLWRQETVGRNLLWQYLRVVFRLCFSISWLLLSFSPLLFSPFFCMGGGVVSPCNNENQGEDRGLRVDLRWEERYRLAHQSLSPLPLPFSLSPMTCPFSIFYFFLYFSFSLHMLDLCFLFDWA